MPIAGWKKFDWSHQMAASLVPSDTHERSLGEAILDSATFLMKTSLGAISAALCAKANKPWEVNLQNIRRWLLPPKIKSPCATWKMGTLLCSQHKRESPWEGGLCSSTARRSLPLMIPISMSTGNGTPRALEAMDGESCSPHAPSMTENASKPILLLSPNNALKHSAFPFRQRQRFLAKPTSKSPLMPLPQDYTRYIGFGNGRFCTAMVQSRPTRATPPA